MLSWGCDNNPLLILFYMYTEKAYRFLFGEGERMGVWNVPGRHLEGVGKVSGMCHTITLLVLQTILGPKIYCDQKYFRNQSFLSNTKFFRTQNFSVLELASQNELLSVEG